MKPFRLFVVTVIIVCLFYFIINYYKTKNDFDMIVEFSDLIVSLEIFYKVNNKYPDKIELLIPKYLSKKPALPLDYTYYCENGKDYMLYYKYERTFLRENIFYVTYQASRKTWIIEELP